ncbi:MAG TPA: SDR family oxidoreductase [Vicinamibacterales bacterium]|nr:SDR family oxidoreductase [Vicinamibacterales bacterium]
MKDRSLDGRNAIITGGSQGLGRAIAEAYVAAGARVLITARTANDLAAAKSVLEEVAELPDRVLTMAGDVSVESDVQQFVAFAIDKWGSIDILVNNAAIYGPLGPLNECDWQEWKRTIEINLYGSVLPAREVLPHMKRRRYGKIVQVSGGGAANPLPRITAYASAKAAVVRFAESLAEEVAEFAIDVNAIAPGPLHTRMLDRVLEAGPAAVGEAFHARMTQLKAGGATPLERAARLAVFLGSSASDGLTGRLISAAWDSWETIPERLTEIQSSDVYTVRRITAADRQRDWDKR